MSTNHFTTTRLLADPPNRRGAVIAAAIWSVVIILAGLVIVQQRAHETPAKLAPIIIITATPHALAGRAAPPERAEPRATATVEPPTTEPVVIVQTVVVYEPMYVERAQEPAPAAVEQPAPEPTATYPAWYTDIPGAPPEIVAACQQEPARSSWVCGGQP